MQNISTIMKLPQNIIQNIRLSLARTDPKTKITFPDFLALLHKEAFFREALSTAQIYKMSANRLTYGHEVTLMT